MELSEQKKRAVEGIQALMLRNSLQADYLEAALDAATQDDFQTAEMYLELVAKAEESDLNSLRKQMKGEGLN
jgi:rubrerythrin